MSSNKLEKIRKDGLDKFYTNDWYSKQCINKVFQLYDKNDFDLIIEPSCGNGSFFKQIHSKNKIGIDIEPDLIESDNKIIKQNYLEFNLDNKYKNVLVIGNPPFGKISSLAVKFFNHSASFSNVNQIAFIIPRTFRKVSVKNKLNTLFHLVYDEDTPTNPCCFTPKMNVKCCFQIWIRKSEKEKREILKLPTVHKDWEFLHLGEKDEKNQPTPPKDADFVIRAYGGKVGEIQEKNLEILRPKSWHWIKSNINKKDLINNFNSLNYQTSVNTARQNSIGKAELVDLYTKFINSKS